MSVHSRRASIQDKIDQTRFLLQQMHFGRPSVRDGAAFTSQVNSLVIQAWPPEIGMRKQTTSHRLIEMWATDLVLDFSATASTPAFGARGRAARLLSQSLILNLWRRAKELLCFVLQSSWLTGLSRSSRTWTRRPELWNTFSAKFQTRSTTEYASYRLSSECERHWRNTHARTRTNTGAHAAHCTLKWMQRRAKWLMFGPISCLTLAAASASAPPFSAHFLPGWNNNDNNNDISLHHTSISNSHRK